MHLNCPLYMTHSRQFAGHSEHFHTENYEKITASKSQQRLLYRIYSVGLLYICRIYSVLYILYLRNFHVNAMQINKYNHYRQNVQLSQQTGTRN